MLVHGPFGTMGMYDKKDTEVVPNRTIPQAAYARASIIQSIAVGSCAPMYPQNDVGKWCIRPSIYLLYYMYLSRLGQASWTDFRHVRGVFTFVSLRQRWT